MLRGDKLITALAWLHLQSCGPSQMPISCRQLRLSVVHRPHGVQAAGVDPVVTMRPDAPADDLAVLIDDGPARVSTEDLGIVRISCRAGRGAARSGSPPSCCACSSRRWPAPVADHPQPVALGRGFRVGECERHERRWERRAVAFRDAKDCEVEHRIALRCGARSGAAGVISAS